MEDDVMDDAARVRDERGLKYHGSGKGGVFRVPARERFILRAEAELWGGVLREGPSPAADTRVVLEATRASLDAARRLRFAAGVTGDERHRLESLAAEAAGVQEHALRLWYAGRGFGETGEPPAASASAQPAPTEGIEGEGSVCREITTAEQFMGLHGAWNALLAGCSYPTAFCTWEWAWEWWCHFGVGATPSYRLIVALAYSSEGTLIGLAPFFFPGAAAGPLRLRPLRPLATRIRCMVDDMTEEPIILLRLGAEAEALRGLWAALGGWEDRARWDLIHLRLMRRASEPDLLSLWRKMPHTMPFMLTRQSRRPGQTRPLPGSWPEFRQSLGKSMRDNVVYYPRLLTRDGHAWSVRIARTPEEMVLAVPALIRLHGCRARSGRGPAHQDHLPGPAQKRFLRAILMRLCARGMAAVALLEVDGLPIAAQAVLEAGGRMTFYYSGFDPHWHRYSPVTVLHIALLQDAIARGLTAADYLPEAAPWKLRWRAEAEYVYEELSCLSVHPRSLLRSGWRWVTFLRSRHHGSACRCGLCTPSEQKEGMPAARIAQAQAQEGGGH